MRKTFGVRVRHHKNDDTWCFAFNLAGYAHPGVGAAFIPEYGDPDVPAVWNVLKKYSPYQNVRSAVLAKYPRVLFMTSAADDIVHPAHARKMAVHMTALGHDVLYFEKPEGGHLVTRNIALAARENALKLAFFARELGLDSRNNDTCDPARPLLDSLP